MSEKLRVNWLECDGYGLCRDLLPELIDLDDWGYPIIATGEVPRNLLDAAQRAVDCCPVKALRLTQGHSGAARLVG
ncbi:MAG TPA: ferredoxin [Candidatus Limnocylindrales bacterium]